MNDANNQPGFPLAVSAVYLTATAAACFAGVWGVIAMLYGDVFGSTPGVPGVWSAACVVAVAVWGASIIGVAPVAMLGTQGVMATVWGYFIGMGIRLALCFGLFMVVMSRDLLPVGPLAVVLVMMYVPLLFVETTLVGRYLWAKDFLNVSPSQTVVAAAGGAGAKGALV